MHYVRTPLLPKSFNDDSTSPQIYAKLEMLQPGGSFKSRGISHLIEKRKLEAEKDGGRKLAVFTSSGGNAGLAAATAAQSMGLACTVVVPKLTKARMIKKIEKAGATVVVRGDHWGQADSYLREELMVQVQEQGLDALYVHPFDDETIWAGHSTIVDEIVEQLKEQGVPLSKLKGIVCSVGGGGLFSGIIKGLERYGLADSVPVAAVETEGCNVLAKSVAEGAPVVLDKITSVATSLGSPYIAAFAFESAQKYNSKSVVLQDKDVVQTCLQFADDFGFIVEPACGASLHLCYKPELLDDAFGRKSSLTRDDVVVVIACGGSCMTYEDMLKLQKVME
ncbi:LADA_0E00430g1_1 [Lachancea dasiensis]|uniref:L-serine ammonia-lyase n=1 Tax=Lachancea dasiensis TaxID=1072105 RepID=A0A1G4JA66_9SACH|nr:LADA_0E00430g1_1 [Lachancea dasiensis]